MVYTSQAKKDKILQICCIALLIIQIAYALSGSVILNLNQSYSDDKYNVWLNTLFQNVYLYISIFAIISTLYFTIPEVHKITTHLKYWSFLYVISCIFYFWAIGIYFSIDMRRNYIPLQLWEYFTSLIIYDFFMLIIGVISICIKAYQYYKYDRAITISI